MLSLPRSTPPRKQTPGGAGRKLLAALIVVSSSGTGMCFITTWRCLPAAVGRGSCRSISAAELSAPARLRAAGALSTSCRSCVQGANAGNDADQATDKCSRRAMVAAGGAFAALSALSAPACASERRGNLVRVSDPLTYSALAYAPPGAREKVPLIVVLHGAGKNELDAWSLADPQGEHAGLAPSLLQTGRAPPELANNFAVVAPYSAGKRSFYEEPRKKVLQFVEWACSEKGRAAGVAAVDPSKVFLFGFSDGATVGIELMTTGRFKAGVFAAYGFTGDLPGLALQRLKNIPMWIFHSADDVIFPVKCSDKLVSSLRKVQSSSVVRYTRFDVDQEGFTGDVRGHSTGITASKKPDIYSWMMGIAEEGEDDNEEDDSGEG